MRSLIKQLAFLWADADPAMREPIAPALPFPLASPDAPLIPDAIVANEDRTRDALGLFERVFRRLEIDRPAPEFEVTFYPYTGLRSTIHLRKNHVRVRISDLMLEAPPLVLDALAEILVAKLFRKPPSREARECYKAYILKDATVRRIEESLRMRGRKRQRPARGVHYDLDEVFDLLNGRYFSNALTKPRLGWSPVRSKRMLGHYDSAHHSITISRLLDSPKVPRYLVEYLMFHEMLHITYPVERNGHRRVVHSAEFRRAEKQFPHYQQACRRLKQIASGRFV
jgi:hypothetical protein